MHFKIFLNFKIHLLERGEANKYSFHLMLDLKHLKGL